MIARGHKRRSRLQPVRLDGVTGVAVAVAGTGVKHGHRSSGHLVTRPLMTGAFGVVWVNLATRAVGGTGNWLSAQSKMLHGTSSTHLLVNTASLCRDEDTR